MHGRVQARCEVRYARSVEGPGRDDHRSRGDDTAFAEARFEDRPDAAQGADLCVERTGKAMCCA